MKRNAGRRAAQVRPETEVEIAFEDVYGLVLVRVHVKRRALAGRDDRLEDRHRPAGLGGRGLEHDRASDGVLDRCALARPQRDRARLACHRLLLRRWTASYFSGRGCEAGTVDRAGYPPRE